MDTRPMHVPDDAPRLVELLNTLLPEPITAGEWLEWDSRWPEDGLRERVVALSDHGEAIGFAEAGRMPWATPGKFFQEVLVDPAHRRSGVGTFLADRMEAWALGHGATLLETMVRDHLPEAVAFAQRRGYEVDRHIFESVLDLPTFDETPFAGVVEAVAASGIRFFSLADEPGEATARSMYKLSEKTFFDIPGYDNPQYMPYELWRKRVLESEGFRADCIILAADGDRLVAMTAADVVKLSGTLWTSYTCVDSDYRGRNLALAIKLLAIRTAKRIGAPCMRTNNDSKNAPMLAVNRKLGYKPCPGEYRMRKVVGA